MINFRIISKILGSLLFIEGFFMACCLAMAFSFHEDDELAFMTSTILTFGGAFIFLFFGHEAENSLSRRDAYVVVTLTWVVFSFFGMFPFLIHGSLNNITDAYFETMSGFTTTGATIIDDVESLPHGLLFWRSLMQWIGGLGIVFFTVALLPQLVGGSVKVFAAEATGPMRSKMHPRLSTTAKWIWSIYVLLTIACALSFWLAGMNWFDATNYSMSTTATGGFSTHNGTIFLASPLIEYLAILFQFLADRSDYFQTVLHFLIAVIVHVQHDSHVGIHGKVIVLYHQLIYLGGLAPGNVLHRFPAGIIPVTYVKHRVFNDESSYRDVTQKSSQCLYDIFILASLRHYYQVGSDVDVSDLGLKAQEVPGLQEASAISIYASS